jgi:hypothetical protein
MRLRKSVWLAVLMVSAMALPATAQVSTGRIEITVVDSTGAVMPGVSVDLTGTQKASVVTEKDGVARFLNLPPGSYAVKASLQGFGDYTNKAIAVVAGGNIALKATLAVGGVQQQVEVTAQTPVIDTKKVTTGTNVTLDELQNIPSARDPWVVMQTVPGIITDRVNVGGSESGQQSGYQAKGATGGDNTWNMDGIPVTDMAATGSTPTYYDFDMFQEMAVTTGGADMTSATGGVSLNFILKSGSNTPHGSTRIYFEDQSMQGNNMPASLATALGSPNGKGNRTAKYKDYGFEIGGPIVKDRLWGWGSMGRTDVYNLTIKQTPDNTFLKNGALKIQGQASQNVRASFTWFHGDKQKYGRNASASRPPETTVNQTGPSDFYKGEANFVLSSNLFLSVRASRMPSGFAFDPQGGMNKNVYYDDSGVWHGSYANYISDRPQKTAMAEGSYFAGKHEVKYGFSWRQTTVTSTSEWASANGVPGYSYSIGYPDMIFYAISPWASSARANYSSFWVGDSITMDRATITLGLRYDHQTDGTLAVSEPAVKGFEQWLPAITAPAIPNAIVWNSWSPRIGITYSLDQARKTQIRGSYARFASQLGNGASSVISPVQYRYVYFYGTDTNNDHVLSGAEIDKSSVAGHTGFDLANPASLTSINKLGKYNVPKTDEIIAGIDHELFRNFGVSASFTYRRFTKFNWQPRIGLRSTAYTQLGTYTASLPNGQTSSAPYYVVTESKVPASAQTFGTEYTARDGYHQRYWGIEVMATKRLADKWMGRFGFSSNDHREYFDNRATAIQDPTPTASNPLVNGGLVVTQSSGSGKSGIYSVLPKYQFIINGMYQAPWGLDMGVNMVMRQGYSQPWYQSKVSTPGDYFNASKSVLLVTDVGANRLPAVTSLDFRVGKVVKIQRASISIDLDVFNLLNAGTVLGRQYDHRLTGATGFNQTLEIMNPRILRLGAKLSF